MPVNSSLTMSYNITIPERNDYNKVTYSDYAVFFSLETDEGKYQTQTEPSKLGIMVARLYSMNLAKYQKDTDIVVQGATYKLTQEDNNNSKTQMTNTEGTLKIDELLIDKTYSLKEIKTNKQYEINEDEIRFKITEDNQGNLQATILQGNVKNGTIQTEGDNIYLEVEDKVKINLRIKKYEKDTDTTLENIKYKITGKGYSTGGSIITTNSQGEILEKGLNQNETYTIQEVKAEGYYIDETPISFKVINNNGIYSIEELNGNTKNATIKIENNIPILEIELEDNKKGTYNLIIKKHEKDNEEIVLEGAKFKLFKDNKELGTYVTNEEGTITLENLYLFENNSQENGEYILKEVQAPEGYSKSSDLYFKVEKDEITEELIINQENENNKIKYSYSIVDNNNIILYFFNTPSFKLTKIDGETQESLPNTKFAIYNITNGDEELAYNTKNMIVGEKEVIDGKEYYVVTTDENGEIKEDLKEGKYKIVEVKASDEKYYLASDYYFSIGIESEGYEHYAAEDTELSDAIEPVNGNKKTIGTFTNNDGDILKLVQITGSTSSITTRIENTNYGISNNGKVIVKYDKDLNAKDYIVMWSYPIEFTEGKIIQDKKTNNYYYSNGKNLYKYIHDFYSRREITFDYNIIYMTSLKDGGYAVLTEGSGYSMINVYVYNENDELQWKSRELKLYNGQGEICELADGSIVAGITGNVYYDESFAGKVIEYKTDYRSYNALILKWTKEGDENKFWYTYADDNTYVNDIIVDDEGGFTVIGEIQSRTFFVNDNEATYNVATFPNGTMSSYRRL